MFELANMPKTVHHNENEKLKTVCAYTVGI